MLPGQAELYVALRWMPLRTFIQLIQHQAYLPSSLFATARQWADFMLTPGFLTQCLDGGWLDEGSDE